MFDWYKRLHEPPVKIDEEALLKTMLNDEDIKFIDFRDFCFAQYSLGHMTPDCWTKFNYWFSKYISSRFKSGDLSLLK